MRPPITRRRRPVSAPRCQYGRVRVPVYVPSFDFSGISFVVSVGDVVAWELAVTDDLFVPEDLLHAVEDQAEPYDNPLPPDYYPRSCVAAHLSRGGKLIDLSPVPYAIVANPDLEWQQLDQRSVEVGTLGGRQRIAVRLLFDEAGEVVKTVAQRPRVEAGNAITTWVGV